MLLVSHSDGRVAHVDADLRRPETILTDPVLRGMLNLTRPVGLTLIGILMLLADTDNP